MSHPEGFIARARAALARTARDLLQGGQSPALRWRRRGGTGALEPVRQLADIRLEDLQCIERQKSAVVRNTRQFLQGLPANNVLLWGPRGTGKSSLVRALFNAFHGDGLRLVEVQRDLLADLPDVCDRLAAWPHRFIIYCDDLSFEADDPDFKALKTALDGSIRATPDNVLIYATSNRRHLMPEYMSENRDSRLVNGELHLSEAAEEKLSLSERFGIRLAFHPFDQEQYLAIVDYWLGRLQAPVPDRDAVHAAALQWALEQGSRSGRSAWHFARDWAGRRGLGSP